MLQQTNSDRCKAYRKRKTPGHVKKNPITNAEKCKRYRKNKKIKSQENLNNADYANSHENLNDHQKNILRSQENLNNADYENSHENLNDASFHAISMISAEMLFKIDLRLKQITANYNVDFGGIDVILIGDLRQAPPVRATLIYKPIKERMVGPHLWRNLKFFQLIQVMRQANAAFSSILTKIGNGDVLELIQSRFFKKADTQRLSPHGIRLFHTNFAVDAYNNDVLQNSPNKVISIANDVITGTKNAEQEASFRAQLHKKSVIDTGGLPYQITFVTGMYYLITTNIDVTDGLVNGSVGKLLHLEFNADNIVCRLWLQFCGAPKVGMKARKKAASLAVQNQVGVHAVPIELRTSNIIMTKDRKITIKRKHFPIISACAMTIHKSQGGTFDEVVYEYQKRHPQELVYVALSRVTSIEGLFLVIPEDDDTKFRFYHNRVQAVSTVSLIQEFKRLSANKLKTKSQIILDFISKKKGISIYTHNIQSLRKHSNDLTDPILENTNFFLLSETWLKNEEECDLPNFNCITHFKRNSVRSGGVAIYQNKQDKVNIITSHMDIIMNNVRSLNVRSASVADLCAVECALENGINLIMVIIYVSPNQKLIDIQEFIHKALLEYSKNVSQMFTRYGNTTKIPLILAGDFNINFSEKSSQPLIDFLADEFDLQLNNDPKEYTTRYHTTIDGVFSRYLSNIQTQIYAAYFSYHKPLVTCIE